MATALLHERDGAGAGLLECAAESSDVNMVEYLVRCLTSSTYDSLCCLLRFSLPLASRQGLNPFKRDPANRCLLFHSVTLFPLYDGYSSMRTSFLSNRRRCDRWADIISIPRACWWTLGSTRICPISTECENCTW